MKWPPLPNEVPVLRERFFKYLTVAGPDDCWVWNGARAKGGYGWLVLRWNKQRRTFGCHRLALLFAGQTFLRTDMVLHSCDNPPCCNPAHLRVGTARDNVRDRSARHRHTWARGERAHAAVLDASRVLSARAWLDCGYSQSDIAYLLGTSQTLISAIKRREVWAHL